jgi:hypothetical protein
MGQIRGMGAMGPQTVEEWGASLQTPPGGYETMSMQVTPTANLPVESIPAEQRIQMTPAQIAAARATQTPPASNLSKYVLYALLGLGIYFMFIRKPGNESQED